MHQGHESPEVSPKLPDSRCSPACCVLRPRATWPRWPAAGSVTSIVSTNCGRPAGLHPPPPPTNHPTPTHQQLSQFSCKIFHELGTGIICYDVGGRRPMTLPYTIALYTSSQLVNCFMIMNSNRFPRFILNGCFLPQERS